MILNTSNILWRGLLLLGIFTMLAGCGLAIWMLWHGRLRPFSRNLAIFLFGVGLVVGIVYVYPWQGQLPGFLRWFFNIDLEYALGTQFSTVQLLMIGAITFVIGWRVPHTARWHRLVWFAFAGALAFLGIDEYFQFHEWLIGDDRWRLLYGAGGIGLVVMIAWMYRRVYPHEHRAFLLIFNGLVVMAISGIVMEYAIWNSFCYQVADSVAPVCERFERYLIFEELFEIFGATIVLSGFVLFAQHRLTTTGWRLHRRTVILAGLVAALALPTYLWVLPALEARLGTEPVEVAYLDGDLTLVSYRLSSDVVAPGDTADVSFYWRANAPIPTDYSLSLHALAKPGLTESIAQAEEFSMSQYPSFALIPGAVARKTVQLTIPEDTPNPASYALMLRVWSGNWQRQDLRGLEVTASDRPLLTPDSLLFAGLPVLNAEETGPLSSPALYEFADDFGLVAYDLPETARAGDMLPVTFDWQTNAPIKRELTQFTHVIDTETGEMVFGFDQPPFQGTLPTSDWPAAKHLQDRWSIPLPDGLPVGTYQIQMGMYDPVTVERIAVVDAEGEPVLNDAIVLGQFVVS